MWKIFSKIKKFELYKMLCSKKDKIPHFIVGFRFYNIVICDGRHILLQVLNEDYNLRILIL